MYRTSYLDSADLEADSGYIFLDTTTMTDDTQGSGFQPQDQDDADTLTRKTAADDAFSHQGDNLSADGDMGNEPDQGPDALGEDDLQDLENDINA